MSASEAKLGYIAGQHRVKLELTRKICSQSEEPKGDLFIRARAKLESVMQAGQISSFEVYEDNIRKVWKKLRDDHSIPEHLVIAITLGQGAPFLTGLDFKLSSHPKALIDLTITTAPRELAKWYHGWVVYTINRELLKLGKSEQINAAQIRGAMLRAITGQQVTNLPISGLGSETQGGNSADRDKPYAIVANRGRKEVACVIRDVKSFVAKANEASLVKLIATAAAKMKEQTGDTYKVLETEIIAQFKGLASGPELLGFDLPAIILGAIGIDDTAPVADAQPETLKKSIDQVLEIKVTDNKLIAVINEFSMDLYDDPANTFDKSWFRNQLKRAKIADKSSAPYLDNLVESASKQVDLSGMFVAQGRAPVAGEGPYLYECYRDTAAKNVDVENDVLDIRGLQQRSLVSPGDLIAEIRYRQEAKAGVDVFGDVIYPNPPRELEIEVGEGVQKKDGGKFFATFEGVPIIEKNCISLSKILVHKGDVNLRTGDIVFDGPVEIQGSVDTGASVVATGDISIVGSVRGGKVRAGGSIVVTGGVITGTTGYMEARGSIGAEFIENSRIHCEGALKAKKSILNCDIISGADIEILDKKNGVLAGGSVSCKKNIIAANIGFKRGALTVLRVGVDWKIERTVKIMTGRLHKLTECQERDRLEMRELVSKNRAQLTRKHEEKKKELQHRLIKVRTIIGKVQQKLDSFKEKLSFNMHSVVLVENILCNNVEIHIGGAKIAAPNDLAGIGVMAKKRRGSHIVPIEEAQAVVENLPEAG